jgi:hypothetical protein
MPRGASMMPKPSPEVRVGLRSGSGLKVVF